MVVMMVYLLVEMMAELLVEMMVFEKVMKEDALLDERLVV